MSGSSVSDCYLCGARNDGEADFCVRCNGQLLKLPADTVDLADIPSEDTIDDFVDETFEDAPPANPSVSRKGSVEDQRLSAALGLPNDDVDPGFVETVVTSIPRATPSADIPLLGTRPGVVPQSAMTPKEFGRRTYVLLGLLLLATAWLGWTTLNDRNEPAPDNLAFNESRIPDVTTTTTTEKPRREWTLNEVDGRYGPTFVRISLLRCSDAGEQLELVESVGIAVDTHNVVFDSRPMPDADVVSIRSRTGRGRGAIITGRGAGYAIATAQVATSRNLSMDEIDGEPIYNVGYDSETNAVTTTEVRQGLPAEIWITATGDAHSAILNGVTISGQVLGEIDNRVEIDAEIALPKDATFCQLTNRLRLVTAGVESAVEDTSTEEPQPEAG